MSDTRTTMTRRDVLRAAALTALTGSRAAGAAATDMIKRSIPGTNESLPIIGLGTYSVFDVAGSAEEIAMRRSIVDALTDAGGSVIDSSPMYNRSEEIVGEVLSAGRRRSACFLATKVWTDGRDAGIAQMRRSAELMQTDTIDLMQVHNRRDMEAHWPTIQEFKDSGFVRYSGITDYRDSAGSDMVALMRRYQPDFVQINYSLGERGAEETVLPVARDLGIGVLINRPFMAGRLFRAIGERPLPDWAQPFAESWGQFFLKFIVSHEAVTCVIPATSKLKHMVDNAGAGHGALPDAATRQRMVDFVGAL